MKNLKKVLALALATVMMFGMMVVGASAAYKDQADIEDTTAVGVMTAIKAIEGDGESYNPGKILCRADAAVIASRVALTRGRANNLPTGTTIYSDVVAGSYYSGAVAWATREGILAGDGTGKFNPWDDLSGIAFAKMLLCVLNYDAELQGYVDNADWALNINFDAMEAGLLEGLGDVDLTGPITREQAAIMAFNAVTAGKIAVYVADKDTFVLDETATRNNKTLGEDKYPELVWVPGEVTAEGVTEAHWAILNENDEPVAIEGTEVEVAPVVTLKNAVEDLAKAFEAYKPEQVKINLETLAGVVGNGVTVEVYANADKELVYYTYTYEQLGSTVGLVDTDRDGNVNFIEYGEKDLEPAAKDTKPEDYTADEKLFYTLLEMGVKKDDLLIETVVDGEVTAYDFIEAAAEGKVSKIKGQNFNIGDVAYVAAKNNTGYTVEAGKEYTVYADSNGFVLNIVPVKKDEGPKDEAPKAEDYLVVLEVGLETTGGDWGTDVTTTRRFTGVTMTGEQVKGTYVSAQDKDKKDLLTDLIPEDTAEKTMVAPTAAVVKYTVNEEGVYVFEDVAAETLTAISGTTAGIKKGDLELAANVYFGENVKFVYFNTLVEEPGKDPEVKLQTTVKDGVQKVDFDNAETEEVETGSASYYYFTSKDAEGNVMVDLVVFPDFVYVAPKGAQQNTVKYEEGVYVLTEELNADSFDYYDVVEDAKGNKIYFGSTDVAILDGEAVELLIALNDKYELAEAIGAGLYMVTLDENGMAKLVDLETALNVEDAKVTTNVESFDNKIAITKLNGKYYITLNGEKVEATDAVINDLTEKNADLDAIRANAKEGDTVNGFIVTETDKDGNVVVTALYVTEYKRA